MYLSGTTFSRFSSTSNGVSPGATPLEVEEGLLAVVPEAYRHGAHHWLILHGRYVCKARRPDCAACVVNDLCRYPAKTI